MHWFAQLSSVVDVGLIPARTLAFRNWNRAGEASDELDKEKQFLRNFSLSPLQRFPLPEFAPLVFLGNRWTTKQASKEAKLKFVVAYLPCINRAWNRWHWRLGGGRLLYKGRIRNLLVIINFWQFPPMKVTGYKCWLGKGDLWEEVQQQPLKLPNFESIKFCFIIIFVLLLLLFLMALSCCQNFAFKRQFNGSWLVR